MLVRLIVTGRVQGVFYRVSTRDKASELGLSGFVKNRADGSVEIEACGSREKLENLVSWCREGPSGARVDNLKVEWLEEEGRETEDLQGFVIR